MLHHTFEVSTAHDTHRRKYSPVRQLAQATDYPVLSLMPTVYAVEIGASPAYEVMHGAGWYRSSPRKSALCGTGERQETLRVMGGAPLVEQRKAGRKCHLPNPRRVSQRRFLWVP